MPRHCRPAARPPRSPARALLLLPLVALLGACADAGPTGVPAAPPVPVDSAIETVVPAPAPGVTIGAQLHGSTDARLDSAVRRVVRRWERVLTTDLPDVLDSIAPGACGEGVPGFAGRIDDLHVFVVVDSIDGPGRVLASGGPCGVRTPSLLPYIGVVTLDRSDLAVLLTVGLVDDLLAHELGHVLGIGVLWRDGGSGGLVQSRDGDDPRFVGTGARLAADRLGLHDEATHGIAIETRGGVGVAGMHWSEQRYTRELMTGFLGGTGNALSLLTILSLRDLGYGVSEGAAEPWSAADVTGTPTSSALSGAVAAMRAAPAGGQERVRAPAFALDHTGRRRTIGE